MINTLSSESTSTSLLDRLRADDPQSWQRMSDLYAPVVYRWARTSGLQAGDAADVTQEVFHAVSANIDRFRHDRPADSFRGWLWTITRNKIHDHHRGRNGQPEAAGGTAAYERLKAIPEEPPEVSGAPSGQFDADAVFVRRAVQLVRDEFEENTFRAFWRVAIDGQRPADIADELGMTTAAVYMAKSRVFRRLRSELEGLID